MDTNVIMTGVKALTSLIPVAGGSITSIIDGFLSAQVQRKIDRLEEFIHGLSEELKQHEARINQEFVSATDSADVLERTIQYVVTERNKDKRTAFRNIFTNSAISEDCNFDKAERYMLLLYQLSSIDLTLLCTFFHPEKVKEERGRKITNPLMNEDGTFKTEYQQEYLIYEILNELWDFDISDIEESMTYLYENRLISHKSKLLCTNGDPLDIINDMLTDKGYEFVSFILHPQE